MSDNKKILLIEDMSSPILVGAECKALKPIICDFMEGFTKNQNQPVDIWLTNKMKKHLPERSQEDVQEIVQSIIQTIQKNEEKKASLAIAISNGRTKEDWFVSEVKKAVSSMSAKETVTYLFELDAALKNANESLYNTLLTQAGTVNQNHNLDGFIAEQYHAQTFNLNAEATGSQYRAKVLEPIGERYAKNSVDIEIIDGTGKVVRRYQSKYGKDAQATQRAFDKGDYRGQQKLVPEGQENGISQKATTVLEAPDGTQSNPLSKSSAAKMRDEAQSGKWNDLNWNEYKTKDLAIGIGKQVGYAALQGVAIGIGFNIAQKVWNGEDIDGAELVETAIVTGADFGVKSAVAGAMKVGAEKGIISVIPKGTPASTIANIAYVAVEDIKVIGKIIDGELTPKEGLEKIEQTTVSTAAGLMAMGEGAAIGAAVGAVFGPIGAAVGGFIGGTVGYMAGSSIGEAVVKGKQKIQEIANKIFKPIPEIVVHDGSGGLFNKIESFCSGVASFLGF